MVRLPVMAALLMQIGLCSSAIAQTPSGATDNELYASYCDGVLNDDINRLTEIAHGFGQVEKPSLEGIENELRQNNERAPFSQLRDSPGILHQKALVLLDTREKSWEADQELAKLSTAALADLENRRRRFAAYLLATGALTDPKRQPTTALGLSIAMNKGREDSEQCYAALSRCDETSLTPPQLDGVGSDLRTCRDSTIADPPCDKVRQCVMSDKLPF